MENKGLIFILDISGFSRFVTEMEIGHSRLIISELLEILIGSNRMGLTVPEIEGSTSWRTGILPMGLSFTGNRGRLPPII